jgi:hypothetical protein
MNPSDKKLLEDALDSLIRVGCQFWGCEGPTLRPINMTTCYRCESVAKLAKRLGVYVPRKSRPVDKEGDSRYRAFQMAKQDFEYAYRMNH